MVQLSVLDLAPVPSGSNATEALRRIVELAQLAEKLGYVRDWFAEHHGMAAIASSSPEILIAHVAAATQTIRVGAGGIMLPNHAPLRIAEAFHTLEALHPQRIDLGLGRAPGTDPATSSALRPFDADRFPEQVAELLALSRGTLPAGHPFRSVHVTPTGVELPPVWLLGSSGATARMAGGAGLGYAFARHFSPTPPAPVVEAYRSSFQPSAQFPAPHTILGVSVVCAPTAEEADYLASSMDLSWVRLRKGEFAPLPSPEEARAYSFSPADRAVVDSHRALQFVGDPRSVSSRIEALIAETRADEIMVTSMIHDHAARLRSFELLSRSLS